MSTTTRCSKRCPRRYRWNDYAAAAVLGLSYGALAAKRSDRMPMVFMLNAGLWELLQMSRNERLFMMNQTDGWMGMGGWMGGGMWIWPVIATLVVVLLVVLIMKVSKK